MARDWPVLGARVPPELVQALEAWCTRSGWNRSRTVEFAIRRLLDQLPLGPGDEGGRENVRDREPLSVEGTGPSRLVADPAPVREKASHGRLDPNVPNQDSVDLRSRKLAQIADPGPAPKAVGIPVSRPPPPPPPVGLEAFSKTEIQQLTIQAWSFARTAREAKDPVGVLREALRRALTDMNRTDLADLEIDRILQELADGSEKDRRPPSPTIQQVLEGRSRA